MMKTKRVLLCGLSAAMLAAAALGFAACGDGDEEHTTHPDENGDGICDIGGEQLTTPDPDPTPDPDDDEVTMTDGIYLSDPIDMGSGRGNAYNYVRFHEDGIFYYAQMAQPSTPGGGMSAAGYWEIVEESYTFFDGTSNKEMTVDSYIAFTNFDGTLYGIHQTNGGQEGASPEYDNKVPMVDDALLGVWYSNMKYTHVLDNEDYTLEDETDIEVAYFVKEVGAADGLILNHTGTFEDLVSDTMDIYDGTWTYDAATRTYTLTDDDLTAKLTVSEDGMTATYVDFKGNTQELVSNNYTEEGEVTAVVQSTNMFFTLSFYNDGTYDVVASISGQTQEMASGVWSLAIPTLTLDGTDYTMTSDGIEVTFALTTSQGTSDYNFVLTRDQLVMLSQTEILAPEPIVEATKDFFTLAFYADGTYKVTAAMGELVQEMLSGTWSLTIPTLTIDETDYTMTSDGITVTLSITTSQGPVNYDFSLTRDQLLALNG